jgi:ABC-type transport system involved in multi-copper enzyme maturation permease subunit
MIYVGIAFAAAGLLRSGGAGLGVGIAFVVVEQIVGQIFSGFGGTLADISQFLPAALVQSVLSTNQLGAGTFGEDVGFALLEAWTAGVVLFVYFMVLVGGTIWVFNRRDITGGGE